MRSNRVSIYLDQDLKINSTLYFFYIFDKFLEKFAVDIDFIFSKFAGF